MNFWVQAAGSTVLGAIILALINAVVQRKNLGAQTNQTNASAADVLTGAAGKLVKDIGEDNARLRAESVVLNERVLVLENREEYLLEILHQHTVWIQKVTTIAGQAIPPLLLPPPPKSPKETS